MKISLPKIAILLSVISIALHIWYPIEDYFNDIHEKEMEERARQLKPSFYLTSGDFAVRPTHTTVILQNTGDGAANNVQVTLYFRPENRSFPGYIISPDWQNYVWMDSEFVSEIPSRKVVTLVFPIGKYHLESLIPADAAWNYTNYEADVSVSCNEISTYSQHFTHRQFPPLP